MITGIDPANALEDVGTKMMKLRMNIQKSYGQKPLNKVSHHHHHQSNVETLDILYYTRVYKALAAVGTLRYIENIGSKIECLLERLNRQKRYKRWPNPLKPEKTCAKTACKKKAYSIIINNIHIWIYICIIL